MTGLTYRLYGAKFKINFISHWMFPWKDLYSKLFDRPKV